MFFFQNHTTHNYPIKIALCSHLINLGSRKNLLTKSCSSARFCVKQFFKNNKQVFFSFLALSCKSTWTNDIEVDLLVHHQISPGPLCRELRLGFLIKTSRRISLSLPKKLFRRIND